MLSVKIFISQTLLGLSFMLLAINDYRGRAALLGLLQTKKVPWPRVLLPSAIALKFLTGLAIALNFYTPLAASALILFIFIANVIFNNFWSLEGTQAQIRLSHFLTHLALIGGLLLLIAIK